MTLREACAVLGVDPGTPMEEARRAYRRAALRTHPDRGGTAPEFMRTAEAWAVFQEAAPARSPGHAPAADDEAPISLDEALSATLEIQLRLSNAQWRAFRRLPPSEQVRWVRRTALWNRRMAERASRAPPPPPPPPRPAPTSPPWPPPSARTERPPDLSEGPLLYGWIVLAFLLLLVLVVMAGLRISF